MRAHRLFIAANLAFVLATACTTGIVPPAGPAIVVAPDTKAEPPFPLPNEDGSLRFAVFGDFGTASQWQYELADRMFKLHQKFPFELVLLAGDNLYGSERPQDFERKFEIPYKPLLDEDVKFYAALGNHDDRNQRFYKHFNMEGKQYYSFKAPKQNVRFFALESTYPEPEQIEWIEKELKGSGEDWKIAFLHHPLYSSGGRHGSDVALREALEPLFTQYNVSVVFAGHDHFYERIKPQKGIAHFVVGSGGKLAIGDIDRRSPLTAKGFDTDYAFLVAEIIDDHLYFNTISRAGQIVDSGMIVRRQPPP
jgi:predicted MPP superfamily phosphohydrolase